jgi:diguanylate cyclase (GGDEF)-like protein/PAS domain S-box-containing protein
MGGNYLENVPVPAFGEQGTFAPVAADGDVHLRANKSLASLRRIAQQDEIPEHFQDFLPEQAGDSPLPDREQGWRGVNRSGQIAPNWPLMTFAFGGIALIGGMASMSFPPLDAALLLLLAMLMAHFARIPVGIERNPDVPVWARVLLLVAAVAVPMMLAGMAMAMWAKAGGLDWRLVVGAIVLVTGIGSIVQSGRHHSLLTIHLAGWTPLAVIEGSVSSMVVLAACLPAAIGASYRQVQLSGEAKAKAETMVRVSRRAEELLRDFEEMGQGWFWETDRRRSLTYVSPIVAHSLGVPLKTLLGRSFTDLFDLGEDGQEGERTLAFHLNARSSFHELAVRAAVIDGGEERWWSITGRPTYDGFGNFVGFRGSGHDLTEKRRSQQQASRLAHFDSLTGLANRFQMSQTLEKILNAPHERQRECSVFLLDLDRFKQVNDTLGHPAGDALLKQVSQRLERVVGAQGRVGRLGGDEFQVIIPGESKREDLARLAERMIDVLSQPYSIDGHRVVIGASLGIALAPQHGVTSEALVRNCDLALYAAKDGGRGRLHFYADDLHSEAEERRQLEQDLRDAIHNDGLELHYQPVVNAATEQICGFEALLRWTHPTRGPLSPSKFIEIAEDTGLIAPIGEWALRTACHDLAHWPENVRVAVNVSPLQFANPQLPAIVTNAIVQAGIRPDRLELEITESVFLNDTKSTDDMFAALKRVGVRLALDDFGTGYSSLGYLKKAPFDKIKIDQSFVRGATQAGNRNGAIISAITSLASALGMETTAEGVETLDELELVRGLGCSHVQGFVYERPLNAEDAFAPLRRGLTAVARGPRSSRAARHTVLRKVVLDHKGQLYNGTIRNISVSGALVEGLWNVPAGTVFAISLSETITVTATARWCDEGRMGMQFAIPLDLDASGNIAAITGQPMDLVKRSLRRGAV